MTTGKRAISRRTMLRGAGVSLGLPWLEAALASSTVPKSPVRMAVLYMPNGVNTGAWSPHGSGRDFTRLASERVASSSWRSTCSHT